MSIPDFSRAEYQESSAAPRVIEGEVVGPSGVPMRVQAAGTPRFALALAYGAVAALVGALGYALVGMTGFMVSIVAIGVAWLIAKAMMTASGGIGGRPYQIGAVALTYLAVNFGEILVPLWHAHQSGLPFSAITNPAVVRYLVLGPFVALSQGLNGILGAVILAIGLRSAWQMAAGSAGFGQPGGRRPGLFGIR